MRKRAVVKGTGMAVPSRVLTNQDLERLVETSDEWIMSRTGIKERHVLSEGQDTSDLCIEAAKEALSRAGISASEIDLIIVGTVTGDTTFPSTACRVQAGLDIHGCAAFDVGAACAGFVYGCAVANGMLTAGPQTTALVIGAECLSKITDWSDRSTCVLFGDAAGALVLRAEEGDRGILASTLHADGAGGELIKLDFSRPRTRLDETVRPGTDGFVHMEGQEVFRFAVKAIADACFESLKLAGLEPKDIDLFVPHQANMRIIRSSMEKLELPDEKVFLNIEKYGNTSSGSIPLALAEAEREGRIKQNDIIMTVGFGAGLSWGANIIRW